MSAKEMYCKRTDSSAAEMDLKIEGENVLCFVDFYFTCTETYEPVTYESSSETETSKHYLEINKVEKQQGYDWIQVDIDRLKDEEIAAIRREVENYALQNLQER